ncbi:MAG TPA: sulfite exporter TauE/SafE family protein [Thermoanaerobaculia bacterium]|nr:sulfite exporter TauE/SafE family protein [Thermoanaerobaculia bacterium]
MILLALLFVLAVLSGATATVAGFGIGSLLTPVLATRYGMPLAVAAVSIPHAIATSLRCWRLRASIDWTVIRVFGVLSAVGGFIGALLYLRFNSRVLTVILGALLIATSIAALTDWMRRLHPDGFVAHAFGFVSGLFGGIAGNQGGLRAAALLAFPLSPAAFVATATATGLAVDAARMPIYVWRAGAQLTSLVTPIAVASIGVLIGTLLGERLLFGLSVSHFRRIVGGLIGILGVWLVAH